MTAQAFRNMYLEWRYLSHMEGHFHPNKRKEYLVPTHSGYIVSTVHSAHRRKASLTNLWPNSLWPALRYGTGYQTVWETRPSAETPSDVHWRLYFQLTCVHSALELSGRCALQIYLLTYLLTYFANVIPTPVTNLYQLPLQLALEVSAWKPECMHVVHCDYSAGLMLWPLPAVELVIMMTAELWHCTLNRCWMQ